MHDQPDASVEGMYDLKRSGMYLHETGIAIQSFEQFRIIAIAHDGSKGDHILLTLFPGLYVPVVVSAGARN